MRKTFSSVRLVQEVSRSTSPDLPPSLESPEDVLVSMPLPSRHASQEFTVDPTAQQQQQSSPRTSPQLIPDRIPDPASITPSLYASSPVPTPPPSPPIPSWELLKSKYKHGRGSSVGSIGKLKSKSHKLLCLWPLPVITRWVIGLTLLVSALNFLGVVQLSCSSPLFAVFRLDIIDLLLSPFLLNTSLSSLLLSSWNILLLGLFEESLAHMLGGTRRFFHLFLGVVVGVCVIRQGLGVLFTKSTGWALPSLFFNDALHECNQGLAPFLFALLVVQSMSVDDKYILIYGNENNLVTIRKVALQLIMCLVNCTSKNILWWSLTGLLVGYIATVVFQTYVAEQDDNNEFRRRKPMWRVLWPALKKGAAVISIALPVLLVCNAYYSRDTFDPLSLSSISDDQYLFTFVVMTAPRRGNPPFLTQTLDSYLINWPATPSEGSLYDRLQTVVYTHFSNHTQYDLAHEHFSADARGQHYIKWVRDSGEVLDQRLHVSKALKLAADRYDSTYIALLEDDFPVCGPREWRELEHVVYEANQRVPGHCGLFVATGGSGLFMRPDIARLASSLLLKYTDIPPDVMIQNCLLGVLPECGHCSNTLVTSQTLLMHHIGFNASTSENRRYKQDQWQCGWRHPFNGDPSVITI